ncbi:hypothetical protein PGTUg99_006005 [Puccinia graminis f. sp. tritici]|uniref:Uncharacterized protein n=1 Tax=Puccinia graminis f. sp. tritici TaxID=56615 RepID=A0A5B0SMX9_PUCGR|nr:hypothetical protein PGTUg99_006005 [Puccinia graminis f. sp. tritici]
MLALMKSGAESAIFKDMAAEGFQIPDSEAIDATAARLQASISLDPSSINPSSSARGSRDGRANNPLASFDEDDEDQDQEQEEKEDAAKEPGS